MKKQLYLIFYTCLVVSCFHDKGNYDYSHDMINAVSMNFTPSPKSSPNPYTANFEYPQPSGKDREETITIKVDQSLISDLENLSYRWIREGMGILDTLYDTPAVNFLLYANTLSSYKINLLVMDKSNGLEYRRDLNITTRKMYIDSWFVVHGENENSYKLGNVEHHEDEGPVVIEDAYEYVTGEKLSLDGFCGLMVKTFPGSFNSGTPESLIILSKSGNQQFFYPFGLLKLYNDFDYPELPVPFRPVAFSAQQIPYYTSAINVIMSEAGEYLHTTLGNVYYKTTTAGTITDYKMTCTAPIGEANREYVFWDAKNNRFLYENFSSNFYNAQGNRALSRIQSVLKDGAIDYTVLSGELQINDGSKQIVNMTGLGTGANMRTEVLALDKNTHKLYRYTIKKGGTLLTISGRELPNGTVSWEGINKNKIVFCPEIADAFYYVNANKLYRYDLGALKSTEIYKIPDTEGCVDFVRLKSIVVAVGPKFDNKYIGLGVNFPNGHGEIHELRLTNGGDLDESGGVRIYGGFSVIRDLVFARKK